MAPRRVIQDRTPMCEAAGAGLLYFYQNNIVIQIILQSTI
jgi:hypothetical protein